MPSATLVLKTEPHEDFELRGDSIRSSRGLLHRNSAEFPSALGRVDILWLVGHSGGQPRPLLTCLYRVIYIVTDACALRNEPIRVKM